MFEDRIILCASSAYERKYYFNEDFKALPERIKQELQIMCVLFTEDIGGILSLEFDEDGTLMLKVEANEGDYLYDDIGSGLKVKEIRRIKSELLESLETFYKVFFLDEDVSTI